jgi:hypothetical protein
MIDATIIQQGIESGLLLPAGDMRRCRIAPGFMDALAMEKDIEKYAFVMARKGRNPSKPKFSPFEALVARRLKTRNHMRKVRSK